MGNQQEIVNLRFGSGTKSCSHMSHHFFHALWRDRIAPFLNHINMIVFIHTTLNNIYSCHSLQETR